ncbi:aromatic amino acid transporter [Vibrio ostreicida]|uniref:aromatic amino acid transporter n=1 Tax=Vibrio ostreicida TaxID=526588 RepID=UPI00097060D8|nr:aromatic amino acid transporter [Vibrio ostreicida]
MEYVESTEKQAKKPSVLGGSCIIACVCVGAGMLGLPTAGSGSWVAWSTLVMVSVMVITIFSGCLLLEALKRYPYQSSFSTVTADLLGREVNFVNNLMVYFVGGILLYAYSTASGLILNQLLGLDPKLASALFVFGFSGFVWHSTRLVDRVSVVLIIFMVLSFVFAITGLAQGINIQTLFGDVSFEQGKYALALIPVALTSFGYQHTVSTMRDYYKDENVAQKALVNGSLIALAIYMVWMFSIYGNLPRADFAPVIEKGGDIDALLSSLDGVVETSMVSNLISAFSAAAILSSFIGVGLGVFDFLADVFKFENTKQGRTKTWAITFIPPLLFSLLFPFGFLTAIGYAAVAAAVWAYIVPALLVRKIRQDNSSENDSGYRAAGGKAVVMVVLFFGISILLIQVGTTLELLPTFKG